FDVIPDAVRLPRAVWHWHGRRLGGGHAARDRTLAESPARSCLGNAPERLLDRISHFGARLRVHLSPGRYTPRFRLARDAVDWRPAGIPRPVDHGARNRESGLARTPARPSRAETEKRNRAAAVVQAGSHRHDDSRVARDERASVLLLLRDF